MTKNERRQWPQHKKKCVEEVIRAFQDRKCVQLVCDGIERLLELHAFCVNEKGQSMLFGWQVDGGSRSGQPQGWKFLIVDKISSARVSDIPSNAPRLENKKMTERASNMAWVIPIVPAHHDHGDITLKYNMRRIKL